ncbi:MAG: Smr/MutS family protein [Chitinophagales bacterium]|nr:Smr/MutS family protein [Chitinophagales bacterium]
MKFSIGDKILLKQTDEEGVVTAYINTDMVEVEVGGVVFPVHTDEIDHPYLKWFTQKKKQPAKKVIPEQLPVEKQKLRKPRLPKGIYLSFMPEYKLEEMEDIVDILKIYLLNETGREIQYRYEQTLRNDATFTHEGRLHAFGHVYLHSIEYDLMNDQPRFNWWLDDVHDADLAPASGSVRIKPQKLFQHIDELLTKNEPSFNYLLIEDFNVKVPEIEEKKIEMPKPTMRNPGSNIKPPMSKSQRDFTPDTIDLHIENLVDSTRGMSNADIITIQLHALQDHLRMVIRERQQRLMIIHGLGKGKLRDEVHRILSETLEVKSYDNSWHGGYGFGATEVWFEY